MKHIATFAIINFFFLISIISLADEKVDFKNGKIYIGYAISLLLLIINFEFSIPAMRVVLNIVIYIILARILFSRDFREAILLGMSVTVIGICAEVVYGFLAYPILTQNLFVNEKIIAALINNLFIGIILFIFCRYTPFKNLYKTFLATTRKISDRQIVIFSLFIVILFNFICWISYFVFKDLLSHYYLTLISSSLSVFGTLLVFFYFKTQNKYLMVYEKYNISLESICEFEQIIENYRINTHENKNQLRTVRSMSKNKKVISYLDVLLQEKVTDDEKLLMDVQKIPAGGLRGIIYSKLLTIKEKNINFELVIDRKISNNFINLVDDYTLTSVCRILGVLLDNAIENSISLKNGYIIIELYEDDSCLVVSITNNYEGYVDVGFINNPGISSKGKSHGYGLALVQKLLKKNKKIEHTSEFFEDNFMQKIKIKV